jgi:hypothetical protein
MRGGGQGGAGQESQGGRGRRAGESTLQYNTMHATPHHTGQAAQSGSIAAIVIVNSGGQAVGCMQMSDIAAPHPG